MIWYFFYVY